MRVLILLCCALVSCLGFSATQEGIHLLAPKVKQDDLDVDSIAAGPLHAVFAEMHAHAEKSWFETVTTAPGAMAEKVAPAVLKEKVKKVMQVAYALSDVIATHGGIGLRGSVGTMGFSLGISLSFKADLIPKLFARALSIANKLAGDKTMSWTHLLLKSMTCKFQAMNKLLTSMSDSKCIPIKDLKFRLIAGGTVSVAGFTPLWEMDFPIFEDNDGTLDGALCKMQTCVVDFFTGLKSKFLVKAAEKAVPEVIGDGFCPSSSSLLQTTEGKPKATAGLGFKVLSSPAATVSLTCKTNEDPRTSCGPMFKDFFTRVATNLAAATKAKKLTANTDKATGVKDLTALHEKSRPMGLPLQPASGSTTNNNKCSKLLYARLALGAEVAIGLGIEFFPAKDCFGELCQGVKTQMGAAAPPQMTCAGGDGVVMGTGNPFLQLKDEEKDWNTVADEVCSAF